MKLRKLHESNEQCEQEIMYTYVSKGLEKILKSSCSVCYYISVFIKPY